MRRRDYKAEYARRKARAVQLGRTLSQARGHPRAGERGVRPLKFDPLLEAGLKAMRSGETLKAASQKLKVSRERLSGYAKAQAGAARVGRAWTFDDRRKRRVQFIENGEVIEFWVEGYEPARLAGQFMNEASRAMSDPRRFAPLRRRWENTFVHDASGRRRFFTTDPNEIYRAIHANDRPFEQVYKLVIAE